jgi:hypothetical protein
MKTKQRVDQGGFCKTFLSSMMNAMLLMSFHEIENQMDALEGTS